MGADSAAPKERSDVSTSVVLVRKLLALRTPAVRSWNGAKEALLVILALIALALLPLRSRLFEQG
jgi:hypothetical protein